MRKSVPLAWVYARGTDFSITSRRSKLYALRRTRTAVPHAVVMIISVNVS